MQAMTGIDPVQYLVQTLTTERELIVFLGAGSSLEGTQEGKPYPSFSKLIDNVLENMGLSASDDRWERFLEVVTLWERDSEPSIKFAEYLHGKPGLSHIQLASLCMGLYPEISLGLFLTTNFDDLMLKAFQEVTKESERRNPQSFSLKFKGKNSISEEIKSVIPKHVNNGRNVLVKLFGDLSSNNPIFHSDKMPFDHTTEDWLSQLFKVPLLFIGYSLSDSPISRLFVTSRSNAPVFVVSPNVKISEDLKKLSDRSFFPIQMKFGEFVESLIPKLDSTYDYFAPRFKSLIQQCDPSLKFNSINSLLTRAEHCSKVSILRYESKNNLFKSDNKESNVEPVFRKDTGPHLNSFLESDSRLLALIGESGSGKSTFLYTLHKRSDSNYISLFYDVHSLQSFGSLRKKIATDFYCGEKDLHQTLAQIGKVLTTEEKYLIIMIDGINESSSIKPMDLRYEIEELVLSFPLRVKLIFSCRKVFWEANLNTYDDLPSQIYFGYRPYSLGRFSLSEAEKAYDNYKTFFGIKTNWSSLSKEMLDHIRDPLMLKFISQTYQYEYLPNFAPAALVFENYLKSLRLKYKHEPLLDFLSLLIEVKLSGSSEDMKTDQFSYLDTRTNHRLHLLSLEQRASKRFPEDPLIILEDENIIVPLQEDRKDFKFTYERFYEYLVGVKFQDLLNSIDEAKDLKAFVHERLILNLGLHYSIHQGFKNAFVNFFLLNEDQTYLDSFASTWADEDSMVQEFGNEVFQELIFESRDKFLKHFTSGNESEKDILKKVLQLSIVHEDFFELVIKGLFHSDREINVNCCQYLINSIKKAANDEIIFQTAIDYTKKIEARKLIHGIWYLMTVKFATENQNPLGKSFLLAKRLLRNSSEKVEIKILAKGLEEIILTEGHKFFGENFTKSGLEYPWKIKDQKVIRWRESILNALRTPSLDEMDLSKESIIFFTSMRPSEEDDSLFAYQIEYRIIQWLYIKLSKTHFKEVVERLDQIAKNGNHFNIDFSLGVLEFVLLNHHNNDPVIRKYGHEMLKKWINYFENNDQRYFMALEVEDPFEFNFAPLVMLARVESKFFTKDWEPVSCLISRLTGESNDRRQMALLAVRWLSREFPIKMLNTLEPILHNDDLKDWTNRILAEMYLRSPRLIEEFMTELKFSTSRRKAIRFPKDNISQFGVQYDGEKFYSEIFLGESASYNGFRKFYHSILETSSLSEFCEVLCEAMMSDDQ